MFNFGRRFKVYRSEARYSLPLGAEPARASFGVVVYDCFRFFRRGFLDFGFASARNDISFAMSAGGRGRPSLPVLPKVSTGIADLPTAARRRADEGVRPYLFSQTLRLSADNLTDPTVSDL